MYAGVVNYAIGDEPSTSVLNSFDQLTPLNSSASLAKELGQVPMAQRRDIGCHWLGSITATSVAPCLLGVIVGFLPAGSLNRTLTRLPLSCISR